jgi:small-conductance mechanosensitive channel
MVIRVKFMTKPGDQSEIRKLVYTRIRDLFRREGIQFAQREVRVRITDTNEVSASSPARLEAIALAAVNAVADEEAKAAGDGGAT